MTGSPLDRAIFWPHVRNPFLYGFIEEKGGGCCPCTPVVKAHSSRPRKRTESPQPQRRRLDLDLRVSTIISHVPATVSEVAASHWRVAMTPVTPIDVDDSRLATTSRVKLRAGWNGTSHPILIVQSRARRYLPLPFTIPSSLFIIFSCYGLPELHPALPMT